MMVKLKNYTIANFLLCHILHESHKWNKKKEEEIRLLNCYVGLVYPFL